MTSRASLDRYSSDVFFGFLVLVVLVGLAGVTGDGLVDAVAGGVGTTRRSLRTRRTATLWISLTLHGASAAGRARRRRGGRASTSNDGVFIHGEFKRARRRGPLIGHGDLVVIPRPRRIFFDGGSSVRFVHGDERRLHQAVLSPSGGGLTFIARLFHEHVTDFRVRRRSAHVEGRVGEELRVVRTPV